MLFCSFLLLPRGSVGFLFLRPGRPRSSQSKYKELFKHISLISERMFLFFTEALEDTGQGGERRSGEAASPGASCSCPPRDWSLLGGRPQSQQRSTGSSPEEDCCLFHPPRARCRERPCCSPGASLQPRPLRRGVGGRPTDGVQHLHSLSSVVPSSASGGPRLEQGPFGLPLFPAPAPGLFPSLSHLLPPPGPDGGGGGDSPPLLVSSIKYETIIVTIYLLTLLDFSLLLLLRYYYLSLGLLTISYSMLCIKLKTCDIWNMRLLLLLYLFSLNIYFYIRYTRAHRVIYSLFRHSTSI